MSKVPNFQISFDFEASADGVDKATALLKYASTLPASPAPAPPPPAAGKGKPPAAAPAKGKPAPAAAKANSKGKPAAKEPEQSDIMDFTGDNDDEEDQTGGLELGDDEPEEEFDGTAEEAREAALAKLRVMLNSGLKDQIKKVQKIMQVAKFHDVPVEQGFEFLAAVKKVEAEIASN